MQRNRLRTVDCSGSRPGDDNLCLCKSVVSAAWPDLVRRIVQGQTLVVCKTGIIFKEGCGEIPHEIPGPTLGGLIMPKMQLVLVSLCLIIAAALLFTQPVRSDQQDRARCAQTCQVNYDRATYPSDFSQCVTDCTESARINDIGRSSLQPSNAKGGTNPLHP